jgi:hypothetical protein
MRTRFSLVFLLLLGGCSNCDKTEAYAPQTIEGRSLHASVTQGSGTFGDIEIGYTFDTVLAKDKTFKTTSAANKVESQGQYTYQRVDDNAAILKLTDSSDLHKGETIEVSLNFTSSKLGTYSVQVLSGLPGEQHGTFELR